VKCLKRIHNSLNFRIAEARIFQAETMFVLALCLFGQQSRCKQHLAAIQMLFDWLVIGQVVATPSRPRTLG
jgi:hypothetical protein